MSDPCGCGGPFRVRVLVPSEPAVVRVLVLAEPAVVTRVERGDIGPKGERGDPGAPGDAPIVYALTAVASYLAVHGRPYPPDAWILTPAGELVEADISHTPGAVVVAFAVPFTGTLLLR